MATNCLYCLRYVLAVPLIIGVLIILGCFIMCPTLWLKLPKEQSFNYQILLFIIVAVTIWLLLTTCTFCWWRWRNHKGQTTISNRKLEGRNKDQVEDALPFDEHLLQK